MLVVYKEKGISIVVILLVAFWSFGWTLMLLIQFYVSDLDSKEFPWVSTFVLPLLTLFILYHMFRSRNGKVVVLKNNTLVVTDGKHKFVCDVADVYSIKRTSLGGSEYGDYRIIIYLKSGKVALQGNEEGETLVEALAETCKIEISGEALKDPR